MHVTAVCDTANLDLVRGLGAERVIDRTVEDFTGTTGRAAAAGPVGAVRLPPQDQAMMTYLADLMETGRFRPVVDRTYPLAEIVEAYRYVETGQKVGSVVITVVPGE